MKKDNDDDATSMSIDEITRENIQRHVDQGADAINRRIRELDHKWDMERTLRLNLSLLILGAILYGTYKKKKWSALSILTVTFIAQHLLSKSCPNLSFLKRIGLQTRQEIEHEKYALKALRGDFKNIQNNVDRAWDAVNKEKDRRTIGFKKDETRMREKENIAE